MILLATSSWINSTIELISVLVIFVFVLLLTNYVTKWIAGYQKIKYSQGNLNIVEVIRVANNQYIQLLRAGKEKYLVVGVSKDSMTLLAALTKDELLEMQEQQLKSDKSGESFARILDVMKGKLPPR